MYDDEGYYVVLPDPDTLPEPEFAHMSWDSIVAFLDEWAYEDAYWNAEAERQANEAQYMNEYYDAFYQGPWWAEYGEDHF